MPSSARSRSRSRSRSSSRRRSDSRYYDSRSNGSSSRSSHSSRDSRDNYRRRDDYDRDDRRYSDNRRSYGRDDRDRSHDRDRYRDRDTSRDETRSRSDKRTRDENKDKSSSGGKYNSVEPSVHSLTNPNDDAEVSSVNVSSSSSISMDPSIGAKQENNISNNPSTNETTNEAASSLSDERAKRLALWKEKQRLLKESSNKPDKVVVQPDTTTTTTTVTTDNKTDTVVDPLEIKRRERMAKLEIWKKKKREQEELAQKAGSVTEPKKVSLGFSAPNVVKKPGLSFGGLASIQSTAVAAAAKSTPPFESKLKPKFKSFDDEDDGNDDKNSSKSFFGKRIGFKPLPHSSVSSNAFEFESMEGITPNVDQNQPEDDEDSLDAFMTGMVSEEVQKESKGVEDRIILNDADRLDGVKEEDDEDMDDEKTVINAKEFMAMLEKKKQKDVPVIDHSKIEYEPFRKSFYVPPQEVEALTEEEVADLRKLLDDTKIHGTNCPKPVLKWSQFGLPAPTMKVIDSLGYKEPYSIQCQAIPAIMSGRDLIAIAKTGSGKTIAFLLPLFRQIKDQPPLKRGDGPMAIVMTPTRELAAQIFAQIQFFLKALNLRAVCAYGGAPIQDQIADIKRGAEIMVCTPGRMIDLLAANSGRVLNLQRVTYLVLDEADRMFDMGFGPQVSKIINNVRPDRQTVLFSATFPPNMEALARKILHNPLQIVIGGNLRVAKEIEQHVEVINQDDKFSRCLELLGQYFHKAEEGRAIIFVERQLFADTLLTELLSKGYNCLSIHGGKEQQEREDSIKDFRAGVVNVLVATSVAARGLDIADLGIVINYDCPHHQEDYIHRVGRTGRAEKLGESYTFIRPDEDKYAYDMARIFKANDLPLPESVEKLAGEFKEKIKSGVEKKSYTGFGGKGLEKLDEQRKLALKMQRKAFAVDDPDAKDKGEDGEGSDSEGEDKSGSTDTTGGKTTPAVAEKVSNVLKVGAAPDNRGPDSGEFYATLEINDVPQQARWNVTNNANVRNLIESTSTSITTKGVFYKPGEVPKESAPKLYLLIEGQTEHSVQSAYDALSDLLVAGMTKSVNVGRPGKYKI